MNDYQKVLQYNDISNMVAQLLTDEGMQGVQDVVIGLDENGFYMTPRGDIGEYYVNGDPLRLRSLKAFWSWYSRQMDALIDENDA